MKVLVACEFSRVVANEFQKLGHAVTSCDLLPHAAIPTQETISHFQGDVRKILDAGWDLMIAHPPCTHLAVSGAQWFPQKVVEQKEAIDFVLELMNAPIPKIAIENPVGIISTIIRKPDQYICPSDFGGIEAKKTCLWLKNLPLLQPTLKTGIKLPFTLMMSASARRGHYRSKTFIGIAKAMAAQWGTNE